MKILNRSYLVVLLSLFLFHSNTHAQAHKNRPNIIIIMADDLGFSDLGSYGGEIETPNLDMLAKGGLRMNSFYNASRCCPTRASLLTGLYPHAAGIGNMTFDQDQPGYRGFLTANTVTIAEVLKSNGYQTGMIGKWHVSETEPFPDKEKQLDWLNHKIVDKDFADTLSYPTHKGFQKYYGTIWGVVDYFDPFSLVNGTKPVKKVPSNYYYTNAIGDSSVAYVKEFSNKKDPFFMYVAYAAPHWPLQAPEEDIKKYENTYKGGWEQIRKERYERMIKLGLVDPKTMPLSKFMYPGKWETNKDSVFDARAMAVHAAMVDRMDKNIGKLIKELKRTKQYNNTLIMFLSDNGASSERPELYGPGFDRSGTTRAGNPISFDTDKSVLPGPQTSHKGIGPEWSNVSNTPFRYWKSKEHEGGITTPFIAHWPKFIKSSNRIVNVPAHVIDLMATCLDVSGSKYPTTFAGKQITPSPGKSLLPVFSGKEKKQLHDELFWEHNGAAALRQGDWKVVRLIANGPWELYNLAIDRTETNNLSEVYPEKLNLMQTKWTELASQYSVFPKPKAN